MLVFDWCFNVKTWWNLIMYLSGVFFLNKPSRISDMKIKTVNPGCYWCFIITLCHKAKICILYPIFSVTSEIFFISWGLKTMSCFSSQEWKSNFVRFWNETTLTLSTNQLSNVLYSRLLLMNGMKIQLWSGLIKFQGN